MKNGQKKVGKQRSWKLRGLIGGGVGALALGAMVLLQGCDPCEEAAIEQKVRACIASLGASNCGTAVQRAVWIYEARNECAAKKTTQPSTTTDTAPASNESSE